MYKATVRWLIRRNIQQLNKGNYRPALAMYRDDATLAFPGNNSWANQHRPTEKGRAQFATHRGRDEIEAFLQRYVDAGIQMVVEDIVVNGPPWNVRAAVRVHDWSEDVDGNDRYNNRAVLWVNSVWGKIRIHEDYEDTQRSAAFDARLDAQQFAGRRTVREHPSPIGPSPWDVTRSDASETSQVPRVRSRLGRDGPAA